MNNNNFDTPLKNEMESYNIDSGNSPQTLIAKLNHARQDNVAMDDLVAEYMPFIRREAGRQGLQSVENDDKVSLAMFAFVNCVRQYDEARGNFFGYAATAIRNRLLDEAKRQSRHAARTTPLEWEDPDSNVVSYQHLAAAKEHERQQHRAELAEEIDRYSARLADFGLELETLDLVSPKHSRLRRQCVAVARQLAHNTSMAQRFLSTRRLPISELSKLSGVSVKTLEKCRRYIVAIALILLEDFTEIGSFLPVEEEG